MNKNKALLLMLAISCIGVMALVALAVVHGARIHPG